MKGNRKRIGDILVRAGALTPERLEKALEIQNAGKDNPRHKKKRFGKILVELNYVTENQLANALSVQLEIPRVDLQNVKIPENVIQLVGRETAELELLIPYSLEGRRLTVAMSDPLDFVALDDIRFRTGLDVSAAVATETEILSAIERYYKVEEAVESILRMNSESDDVEFLKESDEDREQANALQALSQAAPIVKLVTTILMDAIKRRATDIHIEPRESHVQVRYRVDGNLQDTIKLPKRTQASVVSRIKILGNMDIANHMTPQDGNTKMRYGQNQVDLRISTLPAVFGEKVVIRILDSSKGLRPLPKLGVPEVLIKKLQEAGSRSQGMIIVTGPTGSGKTTTLYAFLQWLQNPSINIITVEDPVEYSIPGITQVSVREQAGLGFPAFMRSALRQDPDIILVGEVRDLETAEIAIRAALTGHLVLTTLHTNDTVATVMRLIDLGVPPFLVSSSISGIVAQRLVRRICPNCKEEAPLPDADLFQGLPPLTRCYQGRGCPNCDFSGLLGQVGVYEYLDVTNQMKRLIAHNASEDVLREEALKMGMVTLFQDAWQKIAEGITTLSEVMGKVPYYSHSMTYESTGEAASEPQKPVAETKATVVVADSSPEDLAVLQPLMDSQGYRMLRCEWAEVYEKACRENPDLIVLNMDDPSADWLPLEEKLQRSLSTVTIPVLFLKSDAGSQGEIEGMRAGAAGVVRRPLRYDDVLQRLNNALHLADEELIPNSTGTEVPTAVAAGR